MPVEPHPPPQQPTSLDPLRDMAGDATTTREALRLGTWAQCSLATARNLTRRENLAADFLSERQMGMFGLLDTADAAERGVAGDIRFPDWARVFRDANLLRQGEVIVRFMPQRLNSSELLKDARLMALIYVQSTHVVAVLRDDESLSGGRVTFRKYDNDSDARRRGTFERVSARQLWISGCEIFAVTLSGSNLHSVAGEVAPVGSLASIRKEELRTVLSYKQMAWLMEPLESKLRIRTLRSLLNSSLARLEKGLGRCFRSHEREALMSMGVPLERE